MENEIIKIDMVVDGLRTIPEVLENHRLRVSKAEQVGRTIIQAIQENGGEVSEELDQRANKFLANCAAAVTQMQEARKPATQILELVRNLFTSEEKRLDSKVGDIPKQIQDIRNAYAKAVLDAQEQKRKDAAEQARKEKLVADWTIGIAAAYRKIWEDHIFARTTKIIESFNAIKLSNYEEKSQGLKNMEVLMSGGLLEEVKRAMIRQFAIGGNTLAIENHMEIIDKVVHEYDDLSIVTLWRQKIQAVKDDLIDRLPALKKELDQKAKANDEEREKIEASRLARIKEENERLEQEKADRDAKAKQDEADKKAAAEAEALFNQTTGSAIDTPAPEARQGYDIKVLHSAGWVEIFQLWYKEEGVKLAVEDMGSKKLDSMKTFCEKLAVKGTMIESKYLKYETTVKAVNRKTPKP